MKLINVSAIALLLVVNQASGDPLSANRRTDWNYSGVPGGVPNRSTVCATFSPGATAAAINSAIGTCSDGVVFLSAGTYSAASLGGVIRVNKSNVTLRGAGADKTILTGSNIVNIGSGGNVALGTPITGATKGVKQFTAANTANLAVGTMIEIDRDDDPGLVVGPTGNGKRNLSQVNVITSITGSTVTVRNPMIYDFSVGNPKIKYYYSGVARNAGLEDVKLEHAGFNGAGVNFQYCDSCWIKGVESGTATGYHFIMLGTVNAELRDSFIHDGGSGPNNSGFNFYGNYQYGANSNAKIENNIFNKDFPAIELNQSSSGFVVSYNYSHGTPSQNGTNLVTWTFDDGHAPFNIMNLYEGNIGEMFGADNYYGGSGYGTALRNYFTGYNPNYGVRGDAVWLDRLAYNYSLIGNVLGSANQRPSGYHGCGDSAIYRLGYPNLGNCFTTAWDNYAVAGGYPDQKVTSTLLRWGNYDYFNRTARFVSSEIPVDAPVPTNQIIPASYAYANKPAWWSSNVPWPAIGPDVAGGNGDAAGHVYKIPAQVCWEASNLLGGGSFSASTCYPTTGGNPPPPPPPPPPAPAPTITSALSASGTAGQLFSYAITATNNPTNYNASGLPSGLTVNTTTGIVSGTPSTAGTPSTSGVTLSASNASGTGSATLVLKIDNPTAVPSVLLGSQSIAPLVDSVARGTAEAFQTTSVASGTVNVLSIYVDASSTARNLVAGLYADAGGRPGALISQGSSARLQAGAWNNVTIPGAAVAGGTKYWLAILGVNRGVLRFRDGGGCTSETSAQSNLTALPTTWSTGAMWNSCGLSGYGRSSSFL